MKYILVLFSFLIVLSLSAQSAAGNACNMHKSVIIDFSNKTLCLDSVQDLSNYGLFNVKVRNINQNLYDVGITYGDSIFSSPIDLSALGSLSASDLTGLLSNLSNLINTVGGGDGDGGGDDVVRSLSPDADGTNGEVDSLCTSSHIRKELGMRIRDNDDFVKKLNGITSSIQKQSAEIDSIVIKSLLVLDSTNLFNADSLFSYFKKLNTIRKSASNEKNEHFDLVSGVKLITIECDTVDAALIPIIDSLQNDISIVQSAYDEVIDLLDPNRVMESLMPLIDITNNSIRTYTSLPFQMRGNRIDMTVNITPKDSLNLPSYNTRFSFPTAKPKPIHIGGMIYGSGIDVERFSFITNDDGMVSAVPEDDIEHEFGVGAIAYVPIKKFHFLIGPGISLSTSVRPRLLMGVGYGIGDQHRFTLNLGGILGFTDVRSTILDQQDSFPSVPDGNGVVSSFRGAWFFGAGYYFSN